MFSRNLIAGFLLCAFTCMAEDQRLWCAPNYGVFNLRSIPNSVYTNSVFWGITGDNPNRYETWTVANGAKTHSPIGLQTNPTNRPAYQSNGSLYFDGTNDSIALSSSNEFNFGTGNFSISAWVNPLTVANNRMILDKRVSPSAGGYALGTVSNTFSFSINHLAGTPTLSIQSSAVLTTGSWFHVAATVDRPNNFARFFVNGITNSSGTIPAVGDISSGVLPVIGQRTLPTSSLTNFYGSIGGLQVFSYALSTGDVLAIYSKGSPR